MSDYTSDYTRIVETYLEDETNKRKALEKEVERLKNLLPFDANDFERYRTLAQDFQKKYRNAQRIIEQLRGQR